MKGGNDNYNGNDRGRMRRRCVGGSIYCVCGPYGA